MVRLPKGYTAPVEHVFSQWQQNFPGGLYVEREGYVFDGWYTNSEFSGSQVTENPW